MKAEHNYTYNWNCIVRMWEAEMQTWTCFLFHHFIFYSCILDTIIGLVSEKQITTKITHRNGNVINIFVYVEKIKNEHFCFIFKIFKTEMWFWSIFVYFRKTCLTFYLKIEFAFLFNCLLRPGHKPGQVYFSAPHEWISSINIYICSMCGKTKKKTDKAERGV